MSPILFWRTSPKKFNALCKVHARLNNPDPTDKKEDKSVGTPDTYIDQIM